MINHDCADGDCRELAESHRVASALRSERMFAELQEYAARNRYTLMRKSSSADGVSIYCYLSLNVTGAPETLRIRISDHHRPAWRVEQERLTLDWLDGSAECLINRYADSVRSGVANKQAVIQRAEAERVANRESAEIARVAASRKRAAAAADCLTSERLQAFIDALRSGRPLRKAEWPELAQSQVDIRKFRLSDFVAI